MLNVAVFTNKNHIAHKRPFVTWYDGTPFCNGRGQKLDGAFIDMDLPDDVIKNVIIPCCYFADDNVFILNEKEEFVRTNIDSSLRGKGFSS